MCETIFFRVAIRLLAFAAILGLIGLAKNAFGDALPSSDDALLFGQVRTNNGTSSAPSFSPIPGAQAVLDGVTTDTSIVPLHRAVTADANGQFTIDALPAASYILTISAPGYASQHRTIRLVAHQHMGVVFTLPLTSAPPTPNATLQGTLTNAATHAPVVLAEISYQNMNSGVTAKIYTGPDGKYLVNNLAAGSYHLSIAAPGYAAQQRDVQLTNGAALTANFALYKLPASDRGAVQGLARDAVTSAPIEGALVHFRRLPDQSVVLDCRVNPATRQNSVAPGDTDSVATGPDGHYIIPDVSVGDYSFIAETAFYEPQPALVKVQSGATATANFFLKPRLLGTGRIAGTAYGLLLGNANCTSAPLAGVHVTLVAPGDIALLEGKTPAVIYGQADTDAQGHYAFEDVLAGPVLAIATETGYRPAQRPAFVQPGQTVALNLLLAPIPVAGKGSLGGRVVDSATSAPLAGAEVRLVPLCNDHALFSQAPDESLQTVTDADGMYNFNSIPEADYNASISKGGYLPGLRRVTVSSGAPAVEDFALQLRPVGKSGYVTGHVIDADTSAPVAGAQLHAVYQGAEQLVPHHVPIATSGADGAYLIQLPVGATRLVAALRNYESAAQVVLVGDGITTTVDYALRKISGYGRLSGTVTDALTSQPLANTLIHIGLADGLPSPDGERLTTTTNARGQYHFNRVPAGARFVIAVNPHYWADSQSAVITPGAGTQLDFTLLPRNDAQTSVTVHVVDSHGSVVNARVRLAITDLLGAGEPDDPWAATTDTNGNCTITAPTGNWVVQGGAYGYHPAAGGVSASNDGNKGLILTPNIILIMEPEAQNNAAQNWASYE